MSRIFLSHSSANNAEAIALRDWLIAHGWDELFLDLDPDRGLKAGERWQAALKQAAERCELVICLVSPVWAASKWCLAEFLLASNLNKRIFGVIVEPTPFDDLPTELTAEWQVVDLTAGTRDHKVAVTLPPGDKTTAVEFSNDGLNRLSIGLMQSGLDPKYFPWPPEDDPERAPYRGLLPLEEEDAGIFFGRDGSIVIGLDMLRGLREAPPPRLLVILGASGAGKSSFMRAGLLPRLAREDQHFLPLPVIRPERAVITGESGLVASLEQALKTAGLARTRAKIRAAVDAGASALTALLTELANAKTPAPLTDGAEARKPPTLILPIDQAEELFVADGAAQAESFLGLLRDLTANAAPALIVLFTIRSDNYERLQTAKALQGMRQHTLSLAPMPHGTYADVIKGPAQQLKGRGRALTIDKPLVDALLDDIEAGGAKDTLPLLAFTLERLYLEYGGEGHLTVANYRDLGGVKGSIEVAIERALNAADANAKIPQGRQARLALLRQGLIPWLAGIDSETGAPRRRVARLSEVPDEARPLVQLLVEQRLLVTDVAKDSGEVTVEPAHEALLRRWDLLHGWLIEDTALLSVLEGVKRAARDWAENHRGSAWLTHTTQRLADAERLRERPDLSSSLEPTDRDYLAACRESELAGRRKTRRLQALFVSMLVGFGVVAYLLLENLNWANRIAPADEAKVIFKPWNTAEAIYKRWAYKLGKPPLPKLEKIPPEPSPTAPREYPPFPTPFYLGATEVTFEQFDAFVIATGRGKVPNGEFGRGDMPVINVRWDDATAYADWLGKTTGKSCRLPNNAEWEYACRAGTKKDYAWGDDPAQGQGKANFYGSGTEWSGKRTAPVARFAANTWKLHDLNGNVSEWTSDCAKGTTEAHCGARALRGGSWFSTADYARCGLVDDLPDDRSNLIGFRVLCSSPILEH